MKNNKNMKFLSESILLEESGLPFINSIVIMSVALFIITFIAWSSFVYMEDTVSLGASTIASDNNKYEFIAKAGTSDVIAIEEGNRVYISIPGVTGRQSIVGTISDIDTNPNHTEQGRTYYEVTIDYVLEKHKKAELEEILIEGMEGQMKIVTGTRSMLQYLLGNLYDTGKEIFSIK